MDETSIELLFDFVPIILAAVSLTYAFTTLRYIRGKLLPYTWFVVLTVVLTLLIPLLLIFQQTQWWVTIVSQQKLFSGLTLNMGWSLFNGLTQLLNIVMVTWVRKYADRSCVSEPCIGLTESIKK